MWTEERLAAHLVEAFRLLPSTAIFARSRSELEWGGLGPDDTIPAVKLLAITNQVLGQAARCRVYLLTWARWVASGENVADNLRDMGWNEKAFYRGRKAALAALVRDLRRRRRMAELVA